MRKTGFLAVFVIIAAFLLLCPVGAFAATSSEPAPKIPEWVVYVVGILFNIGFVSAIRSQAQAAGKKWLLQSGRMSYVIVFAICALEQLCSGWFGQLDNASAFLAFIQQVAIMTSAVLGTHTLGKTGKEMYKAVNTTAPTPYVLVAVLMLATLATGAQCQVTTTSQTILLPPQIRSIGVTPLLQVTDSFTVTAFWDKQTTRIAPIGTDIWRYGKFHNSLFLGVTPDDNLQFSGIDGTGYDIDLSKGPRQWFKLPTLTVTLTPYYAVNADITGPNRGIKPFPGASLTISLVR